MRPSDSIGKIRPTTLDANPAESDDANLLTQDESQATYEPIYKGEHANIDWSKEARAVYDLIRGSTPQPGANTSYQGTELQLYESKLRPGATSGHPGEILAAGDSGLEVALDGGTLVVERFRAAGGSKVSAADFIESSGIKPGDRLE